MNTKTARSLRKGDKIANVGTVRRIVKRGHTRVTVQIDETGNLHHYVPTTPLSIVTNEGASS